MLLQEQFSCDKLNYGGVATVIVRYNIILINIVGLIAEYYWLSVVILAFVKSEGKSSEKQSESEPQSPNESTGLLTDKNSSLEGSLRERVVSKSSQ